MSKIGYGMEDADLHRQAAIFTIMARREEQDAEHGGADHDRDHSWSDWLRLQEKQLAKAWVAVQANNKPAYLEAQSHIGALSIAALEAIG